MNPALDAAATFGVSYALRRLPVSRDLWAAVPDRWRWLVPLVLAGLATGIDAAASGATPRQAAASGALAFLSAMGAHKLARDAPGPYR